ncbi:Aste57867_16074 [Aphanomyces stellatus]|uniref:Aste57867_16074 protein n=1 Tax=Aphanomyces stellatus TaxID=120398 RepID=A0A485L4X6_9STRA|nr:hypothetical protein As57867_016018 [Aphanomyces stellatus]VFT92858.1 Aste57867_16074 [Aphanomyces stellatus]
MGHTAVKRSLCSPEEDEVSIKRCRRDVMAKLTDKFTLHRGRLHKCADGAASHPWQTKTHLRHVSTQDRNFYVAALYTLTNNLGLSQETVHMCISLLDRFLKIQPITLEWLEVVSIACIWITAKFNETQATLDSLRIKETLQQRQGRGKGNWSWHHVLVLECQILKRLGFRILHPTLLTRFQQDVVAGTVELTDAQLADAQYFLDLSLMDASFQTFAPEDVVDAIVFLTTEFQPNSNFPFESMEARVRDPLVRFFLLHLKLQDDVTNQPLHKALICKHNATLSAPWHHAKAPSCACRICHS